MVQTYEINKRIIDEIKKHSANECLKEFLLSVLDFELEHFDERAVKNRIRFRETYERIIDKACSKLGESQ